MIRKRSALLLTGLLLAFLVAGCAQPSAKDRDLNGEAMRQMSYWGGEPGF